jgi:hypothetical protein
MITKKLLITLSIVNFIYSTIYAQTSTSTNNNLKAIAATDETLLYNVADSGVAKHMLFGLDTAWPSEENIKRGITYMGTDNIDIVRTSFQPTYPLINGDLQQKQIDSLNIRFNLINLISKNIKVALNDDPISVNSWYKGYPDRWAQLIDTYTKRIQESGHPVISVAPFNEPDYGWDQGTITDFYNIAAALKKNSRFDTIRISGGNTLNDDQALTWYNTLKTNLDEGNTHQLAGSFDNFASFYQQVRTDGKFATGDELHNVMEPMVGVEYGMQEGIWWGTAERTRSEFVKASKGVRLGYAENRDNWTAASVYRNPKGQIQAFGGTSERQAATTTYRFASKDRDVYYDGYGPTREYTMTLPGGTGYQNGQSNAEGMVNITYGDDIQPAIGGNYYIVNRNSGYVLNAIGSTNGTTINQYRSTGKVSQQWQIIPVSTTIGGDFSYYTITNVSTGKSFDDLNWSLDDNTGIIIYDLASGNNQQWFLEYAGDGYFYIRNRHSGKCLQISGSSTSISAAVVQCTKNNIPSQQWRLVPGSSAVEFTAPDAPTNLSATANPASIQLTWTGATATDIKGYEILRSDSADKGYNTIARYVTTTSFIDNTPSDGKTFYYKVRTEDNSLNRSACSDSVSAAVTGTNALVAEYNFEDSTKDNSININDCAFYNTTYTTGKLGDKAISLNGSSSFIQLPYTVANHESITIAAWVYWKGASAWQRIFDFGNSDSEYMFLTPRATNSKIQFAIKNNGEEMVLDGQTYLTRLTWKHVAITMSPTEVVMYVDGELVGSTTSISIRPNDIKPIFNYIGRSQFASNPLFSGYIDDFRIYNYALSSADVKALATLDAVNGIEMSNTQKLISVYDLSGRFIKTTTYNKESAGYNLPAGAYIIKTTDGTNISTKKIIVE